MRILAVLAGAVLLVQLGMQPSNATFMGEPGWQEEHPLTLKFKDKPDAKFEDIDNFIDTQAKMEKFLETFKGVSKPGNGRLDQWIDNIRKHGSKNGHALLKGPGGTAAYNALEVAERVIGNNGKHTGKAPGTLVKGKIVDYFYEKFGPNKGKGHFEVIQIYETKRGASGRSKKWALKFRVEIAKGGFKHEEKKTANPDNVFPDAATATGLEVNASMAGYFEYKLYASGNDITITAVWRDPNYDPTNPKFNLVPPTSNRFGRLYETDIDSCLDMMFVDEPPRLLEADDVPPFYCLGRCKEPGFINTF